MAHNPQYPPPPTPTCTHTPGGRNCNRSPPSSRFTALTPLRKSPPLQAEPVLLVGETGTGKTTLLSRVAALSGATLVAFNLSQQTDSSDLLGGFKPVDARDALLPLLQVGRDC
jgi:hypothetical protein